MQAVSGISDRQKQWQEYRQADFIIEMFHVAPMAIKMTCHDILKNAVIPCKEPKCNR